MDVPSDIAWPPAGIAHSSGFYAFPAAQGDGILLFDKAGNYYQTVGRRGPGPGEYEAAHLILAGSADSLFVFDRSARTVTVYDAIRRYARSFRSEVPAMSAAFVRSGLVVSGTIRTPDRIGYSLHLVATDGTGVIRSFGHNAVYDPLRPSQSYRLLSPAPDGVRVLAVRQDRYEVEEWDGNGRLVRVLRRNASWFPDRDHEISGRLLESRPDPWISGI
jgi:hypothetical protein